MLTIVFFSAKVLKTCYKEHFNISRYPRGIHGIQVFMVNVNKNENCLENAALYTQTFKMMVKAFCQKKRKKLILRP